MSDPTDFEAGHLSPRAAADRRGDIERRSEERRQVEIDEDLERRSGAERRNLLRRILGERRSDWTPSRTPRSD